MATHSSNASSHIEEQGNVLGALCIGLVAVVAHSGHKVQGDSELAAHKRDNSFVFG